MLLDDHEVNNATLHTKGREGTIDILIEPLYYVAIQQCGTQKTT